MMKFAVRINSGHPKQKSNDRPIILIGGLFQVLFKGEV